MNWKLIVLVLACVLMISGCAQRTAETAVSVPESRPVSSEQTNEEPPSPKEQEPEKEKPESKPQKELPPAVTQDGALPLNKAGKLTVYRYNTTMSGNESKRFYMPVECKLDGDLDAQTLLELLCEQEPAPYEITTLGTDGRTAKLDFAKISDQDYENIDFFNSLATTILENCPVVRVVLTMKGEPLKTTGIQMNKDGTFSPVPLELPEKSSEELEELRKTISYNEAVAAQPEPVSETLINDLQFLDKTVDKDKDGDTVKALAQAIFKVTWLNVPQADFEKPEDAPEEFVRRAAVSNAPMLYWGEYAKTNQPAYDSLNVLSPIVGDGQGVLQEHVAETAKELFGDTVVLTHSEEGISPWKYSKYAGVYTPPHMGAGGMGTPVVLDYTESETAVEVTVAFPRVGLDALYDDAGSIIKAADIPAYCKKNLPQRKITLTKKAGGGYFFAGHVFVDTNEDMVKRNPEKYVRAAVGGGLMQTSWESPKELTADQLYGYYLAQDGNYNLYTDKEKTKVDAQKFEQAMQEQYGADAAFLRESQYYNADESAYIGAPELHLKAKYLFGTVTVEQGIATIPITAYKENGAVLCSGTISLELKENFSGIVTAYKAD